MSDLEEIEQLKASLHESENVQTELDRRIFHLKTLFDVSKDIFSSVETKTILRNFLLMIMGNFGVMEGLLLLTESSTGKISHAVTIGFKDDAAALLQKRAGHLLQQGWIGNEARAGHTGLHPDTVGFSLPFMAEPDCPGLLVLGPKLIKEPFSENDRELLVTLLNNLIVALKNARSFEEIKNLNTELQQKNIELEKTLDDLKAALRKVEILEDVKANLSKFVPNTVTRLIEKSPNGMLPESREQDVSVLFVDIEGYTKLCEQLDGSQLNEVIEKCFSVFMDAIFANNGDVNETAGDGLMVLFMNEDKTANALEAVKTALKIREDSARIKNEFKALCAPMVINMGINSGQAHVGAAKFESLTGSRWTYTARGLTTTVAARIGGQSTSGKIFLSKTTAGRVKSHFPIKPLGKFNLKNVSEEIEIFEV